MQQQQQRRRCGSAAAAAAPEVGLFDGVDVVATSSFIYALSGDSKLLAEGNEWLLQKRDGTLFVQHIPKRKNSDVAGIGHLIESLSSRFRFRFRL